MKDIYLGKFCGKDVILRDDEEIQLSEKFWQRRWEDFMFNMKKNAVEDYKSDLFIKQLDSYRLSIWQKIKIFFSK